jgi:hypothetical protein
MTLSSWCRKGALAYDYDRHNRRGQIPARWLEMGRWRSLEQFLDDDECLLFFQKQTDPRTIYLSKVHIFSGSPADASIDIAVVMAVTVAEGFTTHQRAHHLAMINGHTVR